MDTDKLYDKAQNRIEQRVRWYLKNHQEKDDMRYSEMKVLDNKARAVTTIDALYDCFRFAFASGYQAAQRDAKKKGEKTA